MPPINPSSPRYTQPNYDRPEKFSANGIYVLESVQPGDKKTGTALAQWLKLRCLQSAMYVNHITLNSRKGLIKQLNAIRNEAQQKGLVPIIHFELHGNSEGVQVGKDMVLWENLLNLLRTINAACQHNLFVSFAACRSFHIYPSIDIFRPAPFFGIVGCFNEVSTGNVEVGFQSFFEELFNSYDIGKALVALNQSVDDPQEQFSSELAQSMFEAVWLMMQDEWDDPQSRQEKVYSLMARALHSVNVRHYYTLPRLRYEIERDRSELEMNKRKKEALAYFLLQAPRPEWYGVTARGLL